MGDKTTVTKMTPSLAEGRNSLPREKMISTAVHFLTNPKVSKEGSAYQKKAFLQSKGLTEEEIAVAFARANVENPSVGNSALLPIAEGSSPLPPPPSLWMRINHIGSSVIIIAIACYGIHRIYKLYIEPWLFGEQNKEDRLTKMEQQLVELNSSLSQLRRSMGTIQHSLTSQRTQPCEEGIPGSELKQNPIIISDIKSDIATIKSLLLGRQRFPPAPNVSPMIPFWQLEASSEKKNEDGNSTDKQTGLEVEKSLSSEPISNGVEGKSLCEEHGEVAIHEMNSSVNKEPGVTAGNEISIGFEDNSIPVECGKSPVNEVMNLLASGKLGDSSINEISNGSEDNLVSIEHSEPPHHVVMTSSVIGECRNTAENKLDAES